MKTHYVYSFLIDVIVFVGHFHQFETKKQSEKFVSLPGRLNLIFTKTKEEIFYFLEIYFTQLDVKSSRRQNLREISHLKHLKNLLKVHTEAMKLSFIEDLRSNYFFKSTEYLKKVLRSSEDLKKILIYFFLRSFYNLQLIFPFGNILKIF